MNGEKYNVGEQLTCVPGFDSTEVSGGAGYISGRVFTVARIGREESNPDDIIYWPKESFPNDCGFYGRAVKRVEHIVNNYEIY